MNNALLRYWPYLLIAAILLTASQLNIWHFSLADLYHIRHQLKLWQLNYPLLTPALFCVTYVIIVICCLPFAALMSILGGWLFGIIGGTLYVVLGAVIGSLISYYCARYAIFPTVDKHLEQRQTIQYCIRQNSWIGCWLVRLCPVFPFVLVNTICGSVAIPLPIFLTTTTFGIMPATFIYTYLGQQLDILFTSNQTINQILIEHFSLPLGLLFLLSILTGSLYIWIKAKEQSKS